MLRSCVLDLIVFANDLAEAYSRKLFERDTPLWQPLSAQFFSKIGFMSFDQLVPVVPWGMVIVSVTVQLLLSCTVTICLPVFSAEKKLSEVKLPLPKRKVYGGLEPSTSILTEPFPKMHDVLG